MVSMPQQIVYPTFRDAQQLYAKYSTIESTSVLYNTLQELVDPSFLSTMIGESIHEIYNKIILKYYPNEICIKSSFINQILMKGKKHVTIFELPVGSSRADLCKINGKSIAYEIKTDLDNFARLNKQIADYYEIFEEVYVICSETNVSNIIELLPYECGIYIYTQNNRGNYRFRLFRNSTAYNKIDCVKQLKLIRKSELLNFFKINSSLSNHSEIIDYITLHYTNEQINHIFKAILKHRFQKQWDFLKQHHNDIYEIDYQWFFKNQIEPCRIYK